MPLRYLLLVFKCFANTVGIFNLPRTSIMLSLAPPALSLLKSLSGLRYVCFLFFFCSDDPAIGFPNSSCLFFDLIPFVYLFS